MTANDAFRVTIAALATLAGAYVLLLNVLIIIGVFIGFTLYGVVGAILAIPFLGTIFLLVKYFIMDPRAASVQS